MWTFLLENQESFLLLIFVLRSHWKNWILILTSAQSLNFLKLLHGHVQLLWSTSLFCMPRRIKRVLRSTWAYIMKWRMSFETDFIYTDGSVSDDKAAAAAVIDNYSSIERLPDKSSIFSAELHALYLALDRVETADDDERNFIIFSDSKSALQAISGQDWTHPLVLYILERLNWLVKYQEKRICFTGFPVMWAS